MRDKISKIDKLEKSDKAQAIVNRASSGVKAAQKPSKKKPANGAKLGGAKPDKQASGAKFGKQKPASAKFDEQKPSAKASKQKSANAVKFDKGAKPEKQRQGGAKSAKKKPAIKPKSAAQKLAKSKLKSSFALGSVFASAEKIAKIEAFFAKFIKNAEDKNAFVKEAILRHIKRHKKKG